MSISIIIPIFNEEENVKPTYTSIKKVLEKENISDYEILLIDDGSNDKTLEYLKELSYKDEKVIVLKHRKNFGQTAALKTGFKYATKKYG